MPPSSDASEQRAPAAAAPFRPPAPPPPPPPPPRPSVALAAASCLRHAGLRSTWCRAGFGDRAPWKRLWEAAFADDDGEEEEEEEEQGAWGGGGGPDGGTEIDAVDRLAASLAAREKVQAEACGPRCVGDGCLVAAAELDAALSSSSPAGGRRRRQPLRAALAALLDDVEEREGGGGGRGETDASRLPLLLRHSPDASLPPSPSPRLIPLPSQTSAIKRLDAALSSGARLVRLSSSSPEGVGGGKSAVAAAAARAFLRRARGGEGEGEEGDGGFSVSTSWDGAFWLDARGLEEEEEEGDDDSSPASLSPPSDDDGDADDGDGDGDGDDGDADVEAASAAAFRALLAALGGTSVPGTPDRDRVLLRARSLLGGDAPAPARAGSGTGRSPPPARRTAGLVVRMGEGRRRGRQRRGRQSGQQRGLASALLELLGAARGLSVVAVGGAPGGGVFPGASVVVVDVGPLPEAEARLFLREATRGGGSGESETLPPFSRDVRVLRAAAGLGASSPSLFDDGDLAASSPADDGGSPPPRRALESLLLRRAAPALLLRLSRLSSALLRGRGGIFSTFAAALVFNCDCERALQYLQELQTLGLAHPADAASAAAAAAGASSPSPSPSLSSLSSPSSCSAAASSWSLSSLAASVGQDLSEKLGSSAASPLATLARIAEAAAATLETSLAFARGGSGGARESSSSGSKDPSARFPTTGGHALAFHWISKERALFSSASLLAERLCRQGASPKDTTPEAKEISSSNNNNRSERVLASVALSSLSMLLWNGGDKLLPGLLGLDFHASMARNVEEAAASAAAAAAAAGEDGDGFRAHGARAAWTAGAALCSRGRWHEAREPLLRALRDSETFPESGERGRHRIVSWIARVEYKVKGDLGSAADFYARAARASSNSSVLAAASSSSPLSSPQASSASVSTPSSSPPDTLALEQEAEALEGAAGLLRSRGNEADALACYRAALAARAAAAASSPSSTSSTSSPSSPSSSSPPPVLSLSAASAANNAAVLLVAAGARAASLGEDAAAARRYAEAGELYGRVLASRAALLGPEDPSVAAALFNQAALAARRGLGAEAREKLQRAAAVREFALGGRSAELAETLAALALWSVAVGGGRGKRSCSVASSPSSSLCLSRREARAHARAALSVFEELEQKETSDAVRARHAARVKQLRGFLG